VGNRNNNHSLRPLYGHGGLYRGGEDGDPMEAALQCWGTMLWEARVTVKRRVWASSMQQTRGLRVTLLNPLQPADCWSIVCILHSH